MAYEESQTANQKPGNLKFCAPLNERTLIGQNFLKEWIKQEIKSVFRLSESDLCKLKYTKELLISNYIIYFCC